MIVRVPHSGNVSVVKVSYGVYKIGDGLFSIHEGHLNTETATLCYRVHRAIKYIPQPVSITSGYNKIFVEYRSYRARVKYIKGQGFDVKIYQYRLDGVGRLFTKDLFTHDSLTDDQLAYAIEKNFV